MAERAAYILRKLGYSEREQELAKIAGLLHDIGNSVNRTHHAEYGALLAWDILRDKPLTLVERVTVISAIGNHDESTGGAKDPVSAALVLADKTDVRAEPGPGEGTGEIRHPRSGELCCYRLQPEGGPGGGQDQPESAGGREHLHHV